MPGLFISFEGPEGGGKSTQATRLVERLTARGHTVVRTREPGGTPTGEMIRNILQHDAAGEPLAPAAEVLLFGASRAQLVQHVIRPALARGDVVVCDRFADSTTAYQGYGRGFDVDTMLALNGFATGGLWPDLTLLLDLDIAHGFERLARRTSAGGHAPDRIEREARAFHQAVRAGYLDLARRFPARFHRLDADAPLETVAAAIWALVEPRLPPLPAA